jgi:hypothetical protein
MMPVSSPLRPFQNRVTPTGNLIAVAARGTLMGNRGRLHDGSRRIARRVAPGYRSWVTCRLEFRGRRREVMTPGRYTELFFLDEATALAAGHRPCGECRRAEYAHFKVAWLAGNSDLGLPADAGIAAIDRRLHHDRLESDGRQRTFLARLGTLPDGVVVSTGPDGSAAGSLLVWDEAGWPWSVEGYGSPLRLDAEASVIVLTPRSTVRAIGAGYRPGVHGSIRRVP